MVKFLSFICAYLMFQYKTILKSEKIDHNDHSVGGNHTLTVIRLPKSSTLLANFTHSLPCGSHMLTN